ncbi:cytidylate kinase [Nannocystis exedens]|uniref:Cytidylate kinase n=1 Tax=Nannocystis exedens TaxID=54 RepID=A0A1I1T5N4_9BACT|nr:(d)CMP kinase [Nannocystis exedens]PCC66768.1 cytidylate kinase [Nannocystis exedens]SFD53909.1 cytidylate kinase [Nannocystis exedens]
MGLLIVIDGPAGAGKSTVARRVAQHFGLPVLDTGAIYRTLALAARERGIAWSDEAGLVALAAGLPIRFEAATEAGGPRVLYDGRDVTQAIRTPEISEGSSQVSALPAVRASLLEIQRRLGRDGCVAEGRDLGTVVFPDAPHKFFLTASDAVRAARRQAELEGAALADVLRDLNRRDERDRSRATAPMARAEDAVLVDSSDLDADAVVAAIVDAVTSRLPGPGGAAGGPVDGSPKSA